MKSTHTSLFLISIISSFFFLFSYGNAVSLLDNAITRAYTKQLSSASNAENFHPYQALRRDEAAKFFVTFAKLIGKTEYIVDAKSCQFSDINKAWLDLREIVVESCRL
jgi:hypothetical protein